MRKAFTLVELMVVVAVLAILLTLVATAATGAIKASREKRRSAMATLLREGVSTYYARNGKWPGNVENSAKNGKSRVFSGTEADAVFREVVKGSVGKRNPYLDPHGLFVAPSGITEGKGSGVPFADARKKNPPPHIRHLNIDEMAFGYQDPSSGRFRRYKIKYNSASDAVEVSW